MLEVDMVNAGERVLVGLLALIVGLSSVACSSLKQEQVPPSENGYWKHKPYQATVRLYNGERMPVTRYQKVWVNEPADTEVEDGQR